MIYIGIDIAKDKHDCCIIDEQGDVVMKTFQITNSREGFSLLREKIQTIEPDFSNVKIGCEDTGHYGLNLLHYCLDSNLLIYTINPVLVKKIKEAESLRKTKTDKIDALQIAKILRNGTGFRCYTKTDHDIEELKALTRYRDDKVSERARLKISYVRLVHILFPELEKLFCDLHRGTVMEILSKYPGATYFAKARLRSLTKLIESVSKGNCGEDKAFRIIEAAKQSIGLYSPARSYELKNTIRLVHILTDEIEDIDLQISEIMGRLNTTLMSIPGIGSTTAAGILAEIGNIRRFPTPDKLLAYAGMAPTTYQSGKFTSTRTKMEKRGSTYLRHSIFSATRSVCIHDARFRELLLKKRAEGKHYFVAISHCSKRLIRLIYHLQITGENYEKRS